MILWLVPAISFLAIALVVMISAKVRGYQEANSIAGIIVLPIVLLTIGQVSGVIFFNAPVVFLAGFLFLVIDMLLLRFIVGEFHWDRLLSYFN